ncbi:MAG: hypothetical protein R3B99_21600 [Polyangiales bacterium]
MAAAAHTSSCHSPKGRRARRSLLDAALLAAHFSEAHADERVEIQHADRRHVHKRRGSALGAVTVTNDKTLLLRADAERLRWLLARALKRVADSV